MQREEHTLDVLILGAGAVGCAAARELSRYQLRIAVVEKEADVAAGTSGRNSAVVHAGFNNRPGSKMARLCVTGSQGRKTWRSWAVCGNRGRPTAAEG